MEAPSSPSPSHLLSPRGPSSPANNTTTNNNGSASVSEDCCVKVAVHVRPLIGDERAQGCQDCVTVVPGKPQVQIGAHSFTFDHVYGSTGSPSSAMFEECVAPLVDGLLQGYNATVLAYGQTGSGKTYTMGTGFRDGVQTGIIPQAMNVLFSKIEALKHQTEFQLQVSFIEILKEEVRDLLDPACLNKPDTPNGHAGKVNVPGKPPIQIRETSNGVITLAGSTEVSVSSLREMSACLEQGSLSRATGSTNMNNQSSRSHAIFTITLEQMRKLNPVFSSDNSPIDGMNEEYLCAKLHLVDLAGSERAKRTGSDGVRFKEGVHINKGLLALGNVISALGDEKKRKEGVHVPYRDSKLTRLLQDSLGGNSKTTMIACISPADINAEETLNTLKYANRARNIQNKPVVNRDPMSSEMLRMRQQLEYLQAELCARGGGSSSDEVQVLKERIAWLEAANEDLCRELHDYRSKCTAVDQRETDAQDGSNCYVKTDGLKRSLQSIESTDYQMGVTMSADSREIDEEVAKEWEHTLLQSTMDKELHELNRRLEEKESEMKLFGGVDTAALKQHFGKKLMELEDEKRTVQQERDHLLTEIENISASSDGQTQKMQDIHAQKLKALETQILDLKKKQENQVQLLKQKQKSDEAAKRLQDEIQSIKAQKVQLQHKIKQEAEQFRQWKASREKELLQLRKEGRRNEYERHKLQSLNQRQKMVLQRKTEEAAMATKRLKELLEARKSSARDSSAITNGNGTNGQSNEKSLQRFVDHELEVMVNVHEVRFEYEKQSQVRAALAEELAVLRQVDEFASKGLSPPRGKNGFARASSMSPTARMARMSSLQNMLSISSNSLVAMASQLSEAEERERGFTNRGRWNQLRSMGDAKNLLQYLFNSLGDARCQIWEKELEIKEMKEQFKELVGILRQSEAQRKEIEKELKLREQAVAIALATSASVGHEQGNSYNSLKHFADDMSRPLSPMSVPAQKQLKYTPGIANGSVRESAAFMNQTRKMVPMGQLSMRKLAVGKQGGKLWRWKRSHHQWLLQFKWKWQKPWRLSELIRHSDETIVRTKYRPHALPQAV
ncbi:kinesin-like protein KIN-4A [Mercurialis annua]|uniref:kinesin-like protein KIN-4A n=1 Tax=Mercurialis annua TaxID=3986 RepID=UPI00215FA95E|nr:kinesin-like protein KIN-4A [Mercurialis annua]